MMTKTTVQIDDDTLFKAGSYNIAQAVAWAIWAGDLRNYDYRISIATGPGSRIRFSAGDHADKIGEQDAT